MFEALKHTGQYLEPSKWDIQPFRLQSIVIKAQKYRTSNERIATDTSLAAIGKKR